MISMVVCGIDVVAGGLKMSMEEEQLDWKKE